jgi:ubiquinol-cytochrome c reductase cytochrome b/c1 subunit
MVTGIILAMFYNANTEVAFGLVISITNEIYYGWLLRSLHSNGASFFFFVVYIHMARGIYYGSYAYPRQMLWVSGAIIWVLMIATAFLGYILPWGQMSFWGAMVITNLLGAIPLIGGDIVYLLWVGFSIGNATLQRFYSLHFTLPFVIFMLTYVHFALLHEYGSNNPLGIPVATDNIPFIPYYGIKDLFSIFLILFLFFYYVFLYPDALGHEDNYIVANFLVTPAHIVPEWYFLPLYAVLRSVPNKLFGVFLILMFILCIIFLPFYNKGLIRSAMFRPFHAFFIWVFFFVCLLLGWIGGLPVIYPFYEVGQILTFLYFFILLIIFPFLNFFERIIYLSYINRGLKKKN